MKVGRVEVTVVLGLPGSLGGCLTIATLQMLVSTYEQNVWEGHPAWNVGCLPLWHHRMGQGDVLRWVS